MFRTARLITTTLALTAILAVAAACTEGKSAEEAQEKKAPPVPVSVVVAKGETIPVLNTLPGRIAPTRIAEVRPRVSGIILHRIFKQGSLVKAGDVLYEIDPAPFEVQVASARATLEKAKAVRLQASQEADRQRELRARNVSSVQQYESAVATLAQADADVAAAEANLRSAELDLAYSKVRAPIDGRIGRAAVTEGALVTANSTDSLATIQQLDPVYADFTQSANELLALRKAAASGAMGNASADEAAMRLAFDDGTDYGKTGRLLFSEASVDTNTGQITLRAEFPNPDGMLLPGMYVRGTVQQGVEKDAIAVPQQAIQRDASGKAQVYVVKDDKTVEQRAVTVGRVVDNRFVVEDGLKAGEQVVVEGFQKVKPGATVEAQMWEARLTRTAQAEPEQIAR